MSDFDNLSLADQVSYFGPALGLNDDECEMFFQLVLSAPNLPPLRRLENFFGIKRSRIKAMFSKFERLEFITFKNEDTIDFSGLIKALRAIPMEEKRRLFDAANAGE